MMPNDLKLAIFDCDGTLVDGQHMIISSMKMASEKCNIPYPGDEPVRRIVGLSLYEAITRVYPELKEIDHGRLQKLFCIKEAWGTSEEIRKKIQDPSVSEEEKEKLRNLATNKLIEYKAEIEFHPWIRLPLKRYVI